MDVSGLIASFATGTYAVTRRSSAFVRGRAVPGASSSLSVVGAVWPATGRDLLRLPEARRSNETRVLMTPTELLVGGQGLAQQADLVAVDGTSWEVQHVEAWVDPASGGRGYRCVLQSAVG